MIFPTDSSARGQVIDATQGRRAKRLPLATFSSAAPPALGDRFCLQSRFAAKRLTTQLQPPALTFYLCVIQSFAEVSCYGRREKASTNRGRRAE